MTNNKKNNIPEGYKKTKAGIIPNDWVVKKLGEIGEFKNGINKSKEDFGFGYPFVNLMDIFGKPIVRNMNFGLVNSNKNEQELYSLKKGDILFVRSSVKPEGVGLTSLVIEDMPETTYSGFIIRFRENSKWLNFEYKQHCFFEEKFRRRLLAKSTISANTNINQQALNSLFLLLPPLPEQKKIAQILSTWDNAIQTTEKIIKQKLKLKKGLMQILLTPKDDWKKVKLGNVCEMFSGGTPSRQRADYYKGNIPWIKSGELNQKFITKIEENITEEAFKSSSTKWVYKNTILIALYGATAGVVAITKIKATINQAILAINIKKDIDNKFLFFLLDAKMPIEVNRLVQGGQPNLNGQMIKNLQIKYPKIKEQKKIAQILTTADKEIELLQNFLAKLQEQKKGLMQQLLTGKKRVKIQQQN